jgi:hypothetical protein
MTKAIHVGLLIVPLRDGLSMIVLGWQLLFPLESSDQTQVPMESLDK